LREYNITERVKDYQSKKKHHVLKMPLYRFPRLGLFYKTILKGTDNGVLQLVLIVFRVYPLSYIPQTEHYVSGARSAPVFR
jgi:hypothetical protein